MDFDLAILEHFALIKIYPINAELNISKLDLNC